MEREADTEEIKVSKMNNPSQRAALSDNGNFQPLWTMKQAATYLGESIRTIQRRLTMPPTERGSVPFVELPGAAGRRRRIRFRAQDVALWVELRCPPAADFDYLKDSKKSSLLNR